MNRGLSYHSVERNVCRRIGWLMGRCTFDNTPDRARWNDVSLYPGGVVTCRNIRALEWGYAYGRRRAAR